MTKRLPRSGVSFFYSIMCYILSVEANRNDYKKGICKRLHSKLHIFIHIYF